MLVPENYFFFFIKSSVSLFVYRPVKRLHIAPLNKIFIVNKKVLFPPLDKCYRWSISAYWSETIPTPKYLRVGPCLVLKSQIARFTPEGVCEWVVFIFWGCGWYTHTHTLSHSLLTGPDLYRMDTSFYIRCSLHDFRLSRGFGVLGFGVAFSALHLWSPWSP